MPEKTPINRPLKTYAKVILNPKDPNINITRYSFISGDVIKKENVTPKGIFVLTKLKNIGIDEQEQNGVTAPNIEAIIFARYFFPDSHFSAFSKAINDLKNPIIAIIMNSRNNILSES